jgi:hypothetical protein
LALITILSEFLRTKGVVVATQEVPMKGDDLLGYAEIHCETPLALFHRKHVRELFALAGEPVPSNVDEREYWSCGPDIVKPLVAKARDRMPEW